MSLPDKNYDLTEGASIITRSEKGSLLTVEEHDANLTNLKNMADQAYANTVDLYETKLGGESAIGNINNELFYAPLKNSLTVVKGTGSITFSRTTSATYIDRYGILRNAAVDEPRFEENGLLIEGSSENLLKYSEDLSQADWQKVRCTIGGSTTAPDGSTTITNNGIIADTDDNTHYIRQDYASSSTDYHSTSYFVKAGNKNYARVAIEFEDSSYVQLGYAGYYVDLTDTSNYITWQSSDTDLKDLQVDELANGWYRIKVTAKYTGSGTIAYIRTSCYACDSLTDDTFVGDGSTVNIYAFGGQLEEKPFATSYIPTTSSTQSRSADICYATYLGNAPNILAGNAFSMSCEYQPLGQRQGVSDFSIITLGHGYNPKYCWLFHGYTSINGEYIGFYRDVNTPLHYNSYDLSSVKLIVTVDINENIKLYVNGSLEHSLSSNSLTNTSSPTSSNKIGIGQTDGGLYTMYGHIRNIRLWQQELSANEIALL